MLVGTIASNYRFARAWLAVAEFANPVSNLAGPDRQLGKPGRPRRPQSRSNRYAKVHAAPPRRRHY